jgi:hypothetical protein
MTPCNKWDTPCGVGERSDVSSLRQPIPAGTIDAHVVAEALAGGSSREDPLSQAQTENDCLGNGP